MNDWRGRHIWIIGASAGIGAALAQTLASEGALVAISGRDEAALQALRTELPGVGHMVAPLDVTKQEELMKAAATITQTWPKLDIVIYNAGSYTPMSVANYDAATAVHMLDVNLRGAFYLLAAILPVFERLGGGHLVLTSSVAAYRGLPNALGYSASKAGLTSLAESLAIELAPKHVKVQLVSPGFVKTRLVEGNQFPMPFIISPAQAAHAIARGMKSGCFEIHFPKRFTYLMKFLKILPDKLYFWGAGKL